MRLAKGLLGVGLSALVVGSFGVGCSNPQDTASQPPVVVAEGMQTATLNVKGMT
jgi:hypothetical protein